MKIYALIETSGKQFKVSPGQTITVNRIDAAEGSQIELDKVLLVAGDGIIVPGHPLVDGAKVMATVIAEGAGEKVTVFKYKSKTRYRKKSGHRQLYTKLAINEIILADAKN